MKIAISGSNRQELVKNLESQLGVTAISPSSVEPLDIYNLAAMTYGNYEDVMTLYDGSVFDAFKFYEDERYREFQEQVILSAIYNLNIIVINTDGMSDELRNIIQGYSNLFPQKFRFVDKDTQTIEL